MFTPQKKLCSLSPRTEPGPKKGSVSWGRGSDLNPNGAASAKGKAVALIDGDGNLDQESLNQRVSKLENELFEYQYNMGLLLIEKKEWTSKYEELTELLAEVTDTLKREQAAHLNVMSEVEKREENLKKALGVERQCVLDLEKALREMRSEHAEIKFNAELKLAEANVLVTSVDEKSLEVEAKFHAADAKLAEVSRKSSEIERKLHDLEVQENALRRERSLFVTERDSRDSSIAKQREDLREWEQKLQEAEQKVADSRRLLNQREERANENDKIFKEKQNELEELKKKIDIANSALKTEEDDISSRLASAALKEKESEEVRKRLEEKEKQLVEFEEKLQARAKSEIQKHLDEHKSILAQKEKEFELKMEQKRKVHDEQLRNKVVELENKEAEILHMEEKLKKREQAVEKKMEKVRDREADIESKLKSLKEGEKSLKIEEKNFERERKQIHGEKEELLNLKAELENVKSDTENLHLKLNEEREQLKVTEEERAEVSRLQSELKKEIENYRSQSEQLVQEADGLKLEKEKFEEEWEGLDDKRAEIKREEEVIFKQKTELEKLQQSEHERLQNEKLETQKYVQREMEALKLAKDSFAASMEHEKSLLAEKLNSKKSKLIHDFDMHKQELDSALQRKQEEMENCLHDRAKAFENEREMELNNINHLREVVRRDMEEMKLERQKMEKEKLELSQNKRHVEAQQFEMKKDIEELVALSQKLKDQREQFVRERERFIAFAEDQKNCNICGEAIHNFMLSDLHPSTELLNVEVPPLPKVAENYLKVALEGTAEMVASESSPVPVNLGSPVTGRTLSWLRKCTSKIFKFSPGKNLDYALDATVSSARLGNEVDTVETLPNNEVEPLPLLQVASDSLDVQIVVSDGAIREVDATQALSVDQDPVNNLDNSQNRDGKDQVNIPENSQNPVEKKLQCGPGNRRTSRKSVKAAVIGTDINSNADDSVYTNDESQAESEFVGTAKKRRKRNRMQESQATVSENQTEGHSDSIKDSDRPKRRQRVVAAEKNIPPKRYNLRPSKRSVETVNNGSLPPTRRGKKGKDSSHSSDLDANQFENVGNGGASREEIDETGAPTLPRSLTDGGGDEPPQSTGVASEFSADSPFKIAGRTYDEQVDPANHYEDVILGEEVNETAEKPQDYIDEDCKTESHGEEDDDEDDEVDHPGEASIGKKLWTFLTT